MSDRIFVSMTVRAQHKASDPRVSAWVSAHAGSGKTYVLTQRVLRLLLEGVRPSQILCLTFTKAAAANMSTRIFDRLAQWALLDDDALAREIEEMGAGAPTRAQLDFARRLFARAVETPGGLKIQTIHAFCEKLLHIFPLEANAPAGFSVLDDMARAELLQTSKLRAIQEAMRSAGELHDALTLVAQETTENGFDDLCNELLTKRDALAQAFDREDYARRLRSRLGLKEDETLAQIEAEMVEGFETWPELLALLQLGSANDKKLAEHLKRAMAPAPLAERADSYVSVFYTDKGTPRGGEKTKIITSGLQKRAPGLLERLEEERDRLGPLIEKRKAAAVVERSLALALLGDAIIAEYERSKRYRNLLDYDDLIERARRLLNRSNPSWVLYKLDSQIDHILLDEAQDTSARQWDILTAIAKEFCAGVGARRLARSFFAVGDDKQSIFSFQGAAPEKFDAMRRSFERGFLAVEQRFEYVRLVESFRSAPGVLAAVDDVFNFADNDVGLTCDSDPNKPPLKHEAAKSHLPALVEIWKPIGPSGKEEPEDWRLPLDYATSSDPPERLARRIAKKIRALLAPESGECVHENKTARRVEPRDILIVVRKRGAFFEALIRALKSENVPVAGADRLDLGAHIAVNDLVALGRVVLLPQDDLTLATLLKSPIFGFDDDDLIKLAPPRPASLFDALAQAEDERYRAAARLIESWRRDAFALAPFEFYAKILGPGEGRRRVVARLGPEANDAIDEFLRLALSFEREESPSLVGFLAMVERLDLSIKRDMEAAGAAVRVMTAHAAKGLEAKIVFLPDTCGAPSGKHDPKLFTLGDEDALSLVWSRGKDSDPAAITAAREAHREAERAEHRRLLYVAMTRAEERLYIAGYHGEKGPADGCWHKMIVDALKESCKERDDPDAPDGYILSRGDVPLRHDLACGDAVSSSVEIPSFARAPAPRESAPMPPLRPSSALAGADALGDLHGAAPRKSDAARILIGRLTHALLQHLPECPPPRREEAAKRFVDLRGATLDDATRAQIVEASMAVVSDPRLAQLFGPRSAAEVDIVSALAEGHVVSGRIDRLAETDDELLIADFKTSRPREALDATQLRQLALYRAALAPLYPQKKARCFIVWTETASVVEADDAALDAALALALKNG
ncbi:double-strand break repair helicase AddA [Methylocystis sp. JR02]|uniref:double-strand break repair helicase AddA n=1 Tax=Methylocystis sp. JR02 TaxID=3046284 RepID=UPI0024B9F991|nr:double-strand break repair helicase AddA [Methylocystis sp. JR02]MDJ0447591.1 double-strand break repair helicase AddA [Methylocystis sp. JR02]